MDPLHSAAEKVTPTAEVDALLETFRLKKQVKKILAIGFEASRPSLAGFEVVTSLPHSEAGPWSFDVIVLSNEKAMFPITSLRTCIEQARAGSALLIDMGLSSGGGSVLSGLLSLLSEPPIRPIAVTVNSRETLGYRLVLCCRKMAAEDEGMPSDDVWALEADVQTRTRLVAALCEGRPMGVHRGKQQRASKVSWKTVSYPALLAHWIEMEQEAYKQRGTLELLGKHSSVRVVRATTEAAAAVGPSSILLDWAQRRAWLARSAEDVRGINSDHLLIEMTSSEFSAEYVKLHVETFPKGSLFGLPLGGGDELCSATELLPILLLPPERRLRVEDGFRLANLAESKFPLIRVAITQHISSFLAADDTSAEAHLELTDLEAKLSSAVSVSIEARTDRDAEQLPSPLANILRSWRVSQKAREKMEFLLQFFEAAALFHANVLMSGLTRSGSSAKLSLSPSPEDGGPPLSRATFGTWTNILKSCSKEIERLARIQPEPEGILVIRREFAVPSLHLPRGLCSAEIIEIFEAASTLRNEVDAHGGYAAATLVDRTHAELRIKLQQYLALTRLAWRSVQLFKVGSLELVESEFRTNCVALTGSNPQPEPRELRFREAVQKDRLILFSPNERDCLLLLPLVRCCDLEGAPPEFAFFSRLDKTKRMSFVFFHRTATEPLQLDTESVIKAPSPLRALILGS